MGGVCVGVGIGGMDGPALLDLGSSVRFRSSLMFWCRSDISPALQQERLSDGKEELGRPAFQCLSDDE